MEWIKIEHSLPKQPGHYFVVYAKTDLSSPSVGREFWNDGWVFERYSWGHQITHWMPFPELPKDLEG